MSSRGTSLPSSVRDTSLYASQVYLTSMLDAPIEIVIGTLFLYDLLGMSIGSRFSVMFEWFFFRCFLLLRSRCNMFIPSHEPLCWKSGRWCVAFLYYLEVWYLVLDIYSCSRKSDEGSWWASRTHEWSTLAFWLLSEWWMNLSGVRSWVESVCSKYVECSLLS